MMKRVFVGLSIHAEEVPALVQMWKKLRTSGDKKDLHIKWTRPQNLHVTLKFLGEIDGDQLSSVIEAVKSVSLQSEPLSLSLHGLDGFPDETQTRVLWAGVKNKKPLRKLQEWVEDALVSKGFPSSDQEFIPHITLGRLRNKKNIVDLISPFVRKDFGSVEVKKLTIFESHLQGNFPVYKQIEEFELQGLSLQ